MYILFLEDLLDLNEADAAIDLARILRPGA